MWTDNGCRGTFICNGLTVTCDADGAGKHTCPCVSGSSQVWLRPLAGGGAAVVLHNPSSQNTTIRVSFSDVPKRHWNQSTKLQVRNLWQQVDLGPFTGSYEVQNVPSHGSVFLTLNP